MRRPHANGSVSHVSDAYTSRRSKADVCLVRVDSFAHVLCHAPLGTALRFRTARSVLRVHGANVCKAQPSYQAAPR